MLVIYAALPIGLLVGTLMPWVPADKLGPISLWAAFQPFFVIAVPNLLFVSALLFAVGALTRKLFAVYVTGIVLLVVWQVTQQIIGHLDKLSLAALIDPFALTTTNVTIRYWSVAEKNTRLDSVRGRRCCRTVCSGSRSRSRCSRSSPRVFRLRLQHAGALRRKRRRAEGAPRRRATDSRRHAAVRRASAGCGRSGAQSLFHFRSIVREAPFLAISVICVINLMVGVVVHVASRRLGACGR